MTLPTRPLGRTGMDITTVGFGAWAIGGGDWAFGWGEQDDADSVAAIRHAVELGINWVDTAAVYGLGHSEEVVGRALKEIPEADRPLVFTKCGLIWDEADRQKPPRRNSGAAGVRAACEASLRRLGVERIDLLQFHWPDTEGTPLEESWGTLLELRDEGKIRAAGVSNYTVDLLEGCEAIGHVESLQPPFSMIARGTAEALLPWCAGARDGRDRLQPDGLGPAHRQLHARARRGPGRRRLALEEPRVRRAEPRRATSRSRMRCGRSPSATTPRPPPWRWRGRSPGRGSAAPSSAPARPSRSRAGSTPPGSSSPTRTSTS